MSSPTYSHLPIYLPIFNPVAFFHSFVCRGEETESCIKVEPFRSIYRFANVCCWNGRIPWTSYSSHMHLSKTSLWNLLRNIGSYLRTYLSLSNTNSRFSFATLPSLLFTRHEFPLFRLTLLRKVSLMFQAKGVIVTKPFIKLTKDSTLNLFPASRECKF